MLDGILFAHEEIKKIVAFIEGIQKEIGKEKSVVPLVTTGDDVKKAVREYAYDKCVWAFETTVRAERQGARNQPEGLPRSTLRSSLRAVWTKWRTRCITLTKRSCAVKSSIRVSAQTGVA